LTWTEVNDQNPQMVEVGRGDVSAVIRAKIAAGTLPTIKPEKMFVGPGNGRPCSGCDLALTSAEVEYEFDGEDQRIMRFHQRCLAIWHEERTKRKELPSCEQGH